MKLLKKLNQNGFEHAVVLVIFMVIFGIGGAAYLVITHAETPSSTSGSLRWRDGSKYSASVVSQDGRICVTTGFDTNNHLKNTYKWNIEVYRGYQWTVTRESNKYQANNNEDHECYNATKGDTYRVRFIPVNSEYGDIYGDYNVWGYEHSSSAGGVTYKQMVGVSSNRCLDVYGGSNANGTKVDIYDCVGVERQLWALSSDGTIRSRSSGKCLDVYGNGTANSTPVDMYDCVNGAKNQQWTYNASDKTIRNPQSGRCLDVYGNGTANSTKVDIYDCVGSANQKWSF